MIRVRLSADLSARVPLRVNGRPPFRLRAVPDTGFTGALCLSKRWRKRTAAMRIGHEFHELADGRVVRVPTYLGEVAFDGERLRVLLSFADSEDSLIGTAMLLRKRVLLRYGRKTCRISGDC